MNLLVNSSLGWSQDREQFVKLLTGHIKKELESAGLPSSTDISIQMEPARTGMGYIECRVGGDVSSKSISIIENAMRMMVDAGYPHALVLTQELLRVHAGAKASLYRAA